VILDAALPPIPLNSISKIARSAEEMGFGALWTTETVHDPFLAAAFVAESTRSIGFGTSIAIAFSRSPTNIAYTAWDLAQFSQGRFILGLGTQVKAHIERRFGMPWPDSVIGKFREQIQAIRALWNCWQTGEPLNFRGNYYKLTLMSPFFNPGPIMYPQIPIYIAGVNTGLARLAGEIADGFIVHPLHTDAYLQKVILPAIQEGASKNNRALKDIVISASAFVATSPEEESFVRAQIAFYASTPSYRNVLRLHGWEDIAEQLSKLAARGSWGDMPAVIDQAMLNKFAIVCPEEDLPAKIQARYHGIVDRLSLYIPYSPGERDELWRLCLERSA
jgi:probable F420-dependent oxidoreductase